MWSRCTTSIDNLIHVVIYFPYLKRYFLLITGNTLVKYVNKICFAIYILVLKMVEKQEKCIKDEDQ